MLLHTLGEIKARVFQLKVQGKKRGDFLGKEERKSRIINELEVKSCSVSGAGINAFC